MPYSLHHLGWRAVHLDTESMVLNPVMPRLGFGIHELHAGVEFGV